MPDAERQLKELTKVAEETLATLKSVTGDNTRLSTKLAQQEQAIKKQSQMLDAYAHVFALVKEGEIDASQAEEELERILKLGLTTYKEASVASGVSDRQFGEMLPAENSFGSLENQKTASMLDGREVSALEAWMLQWREIRKGIPSGLST